MTDDTGPTPAAIDAVTELLRAAEQTLIGITFTPDPEGWSVGYMRGMGGGDLATAYSLEDAARAALRPLLLSCTDLVGHTVEEFLNVCGDLGPGVDGLAGQADRDVLQGAQGLDEFLDADPGPLL